MSKEFVKERVLKYLMEDLLVPQDMIDTNVPLSEFEEGAEGVLDIIVNVVVKEDGEDFYVPVLIATCVDEDFVMEGAALQKEIDFLEDVDNITTAGRMILTNGNEMMYADWTGEEYDTEASLPTYDQMKKEFFEMEEKIKREEMMHGHECGCGCGHDHSHEHNHEDGCGCGHDHHYELVCKNFIDKKFVNKEFIYVYHKNAKICEKIKVFTKKRRIIL